MNNLNFKQKKKSPGLRGFPHNHPSINRDSQQQNVEHHGYGQYGLMKCQYGITNDKVKY